MLTTQRIFDIGSYRECHVFEFFDFIKGTMLRKGINKCSQHTDSRITGSTTTKPYHDMLRPSTYSISHQLSCAITSSHHRIALFSCQ